MWTEYNLWDLQITEYKDIIQQSSGNKKNLGTDVVLIEKFVFIAK